MQCCIQCKLCACMLYLPLYNGSIECIEKMHIWKKMTKMSNKWKPLWWLWKFFSKIRIFLIFKLNFIILYLYGLTWGLRHFLFPSINVHLCTFLGLPHELVDIDDMLQTSTRNSTECKTASRGFCTCLPFAYMQSTDM